MEDLLNLILKDAFKKKELIFYRQLCHLGPEILVTVKEEEADYGPKLGIGILQDNMEACHVEVAVKYLQ